MTRGRSDASRRAAGLFDSRLSRSPGSGYPSCRRDLCLPEPNLADPQGYYNELGVPPWASPAEVRSAVRRAYLECHPDTSSEPDPERLRRVSMIASVLLDPVQRDRYNRTPPGKRLVDALYLSEPRHAPAVAAEPRTRRPRGWDYLAFDHRTGDAALAQLWYGAFLAAAPLAGYRTRVVVLVHDGPPGFSGTGHVFSVPRSWSPTAANAFAILVRHAGRRSPSVAAPVLVSGCRAPGGSSRGARGPRATVRKRPGGATR